MHLIVIIGPPAVGKYTIGKLVAQRTRYRLFHNHLTTDLALSILDYGSEGFFTLMSDLRLQCFEAAVRSNVCGVVFTCAFAFPEAEGFAMKIENMVMRSGGRCDYVRLHCSQETLEARVSSPERQSFGKIADAVHLRSAIERFNLMNALPGKAALTVDTSVTSPVDACERICKQLALS